MRIGWLNGLRGFARSSRTRECRFAQLGAEGKSPRKAAPFGALLMLLQVLMAVFMEN